jgi:tetratricopeptide (TPR) repeat protein
VNILHLAFNAYWIWVFGTLAEEIFGHLRTFGFFLLLAVAANGGEYAVLSGGVGLSGVGYGLLGMMWVLSRHDRRFTDAVDARTVGLFVAWFFICIIMTLLGTPIANLAHGIGAGTGLMLGFAISKPPIKWRIPAALGLIVLVAVVIAGATIGRPWINFSGDGYGEANFGYEALRANKNTEAVKWYLDAIRMQPREANYWYNLGVAYNRLNRDREARNAFARAVALDSSDKTYQAATRSDDSPSGN